MRSIKQYIHYLLLALPVMCLCACSEAEDDEEEFPDWQDTNEAYFTELYYTTSKAIAAGSSEWKIIRGWSIPDDDDDFIADKEDHIIVQVLTEGTGTGSPIYTDNTWVHYRGRLLPSTSYSDGYVFDQSYYGEYNALTATPTELAVADVVDGFATALQKMVLGDKWRVYIPYQLGYGTSGSGSVPGYSTLIFEIELVAYARSDAEMNYTW